jgi:hypothetical protein
MSRSPKNVYSLQTIAALATMTLLSACGGSSPMPVPAPSPSVIPAPVTATEVLFTIAHKADRKTVVVSTNAAEELPLSCRGDYYRSSAYLLACRDKNNAVSVTTADGMHKESIDTDPTDTAFFDVAGKYVGYLSHAKTLVVKDFGNNGATVFTQDNVQNFSMNGTQVAINGTSANPNLQIKDFTTGNDVVTLVSPGRVEQIQLSDSLLSYKVVSKKLLGKWTLVPAKLYLYNIQTAAFVAHPSKVDADLFIMKNKAGAPEYQLGYGLQIGSSSYVRAKGVKGTSYPTTANYEVNLLDGSMLDASTLPTEMQGSKDWTYKLQGNQVLFFNAKAKRAQVLNLETQAFTELTGDFGNSLEGIQLN